MDVGFNTFDENRASVIGEHPRGYIHQGRLSGTVFADDAEHLAGVHGQIHTVQCEGSRKAFGNALEFQEKTLHGALSLATRVDMIRTNIIAKPLRACCQYWEIPSWSMLFFSKPMKTAPSIEQSAVPLPPDMSAPPMMTAAMTSNS